MNWRINISLAILIGLGISCGSSADECDLISVKKLASVVRSNSNTQIIDIRPGEEYASNHIPGAIQIWRNEMQDANHSVHGMRLSKEELENLLSKKGMSSKDSIFLYDAKGNVDAARLWWMLRLYGFEKVALVNGGLIAWIAAGQGTEEGLVHRIPRSFTISGEADPSLLAEKDDVRQNQFDQLIDARSMDEFDGKYIKNDAFRAGHIPGSVHLDYYDLINPSTFEFRSKEELQALFAQKGVKESGKTVVYCHSGVRSALSTFVFREIMDMSDVSNYDGSWIEWSEDESLPAEKNIN